MSLKLKIVFGILVLFAGFLLTKIGIFAFNGLRTATISQALEKNHDPENPLTRDSDHDGLSDRDEIIYSTDPANPDSDGDRYLDGEEVATGHDPRDADSNEKNGRGLLNTEEPDGKPNLTNRYINSMVASMLTPEGQFDRSQLTKDQYTTVLASIVEQTQVAFYVPPLQDKDITISEDNSKENVKKFLTTVFGIIGNDFLGSSAITNEINNITHLDKSEASDLYYNTYRNLKAVSVPSQWKEIHKQFMHICLELSLSYSFLSGKNLNDDPMKAAVALSYIQSAYLKFTDLTDQFANLVSQQGLFSEAEVKDAAKIAPVTSILPAIK